LVFIPPAIEIDQLYDIVQKRTLRFPVTSMLPSSNSFVFMLTCVGSTISGYVTLIEFTPLNGGVVLDTSSRYKENL